ncbi:sensor domain-containing diguanylate cyclase [Massilia sp. PAMC28688]|uniref:GGDEF domain-containing protein n=1 Tax=Massilia sp. PAMC28688 TaxID=2861283 RepID=UPI001C637D60|nr:sensor domain-containing diguanylate cyclase [Massilia sp. PAMC28688]QYF92722.1 sensor domain-containing diguanylate cyclase [Massilia sp. PAMC28688]
MKPEQILASLSQLDHQKRPVTLWAIVFLSLVCLSLGGMQGWSVYTARAMQLDEAATAASNLASALAEQVSQDLDKVDLTLLDLGERLERESMLGEPAPLDDYLAARLRRLPLLHALAGYDDDGAALLASEGAAVPAATINSHLVQHRYLPAAQLFVGSPLRDAASSQWLLPVSRPLTADDGSFRGVAMALIRIGHLRGLQGMQPGTRGNVVLALESGQLLHTLPRNHDVGRDIRNSTLFAVRRGAGPAGSRIVGPPAGSSEAPTLYSYQNVPGYPLLIAVSRSTDEILARWWDSAYLSTAGVSLLMLIQLWLGVRLYSQISLRDQLEKERRNLQKLLVKKSRSLRQQALRDALTGIANRRQFDTRLVREFDRAMAEGRSLALIILDVDYFKKYNDLYGHPAGDECLKFVAARIHGGRRRSHDLAARLGGEEFAILLPGTGLRGAIAVAEAIRKSVAAHKLTHVPGRAHSVTVSCGVHALVPIEGMVPSELIDAADRALYLAKASGRNRVRAEGSMPPSGVKRLSLVINK